MRFSLIAALATAATVSAVPNNLWATTSTTSTKPTATSTSAYPTSTSESTCTYACVLPSLIEILTCTNVLTDLSIGIPISILDLKRSISKRNGDTDYCCFASPTLASVIECVDIANGAEISIPVSILNGI